MGVYGVSLANRRTIFLAVLALIASLLAVGFNAPAASGASGDATVTIITGDAATGVESGTVDVTAEITAIDTVATIPAPLSVEFNQTSGSASGADYSLSNATFDWPTGSGVGDQSTITITITSDTIDEGASEDAGFELQNPTPGTTFVDSAFALTITDDDPTPSLSVNDVAVDESAPSLTFTVTASTDV